jgi:hypothetical protein
VPLCTDIRRASLDRPICCHANSPVSVSRDRSKNGKKL